MITWKEAKTLSQTVYELVQAGQTKTKEFQLLIQYYGREKLLALYRREKEKKEGGQGRPPLLDSKK